MQIVMIEPKLSGPHLLSEFHIPRLGLPILGTILKNQGHDVKIFAEEIKSVDLSEVEKADLVCISAITPTAPQSYQFAQKIKEMKIPVVMGGPHVTFCPEEALDFADYVIRYEGEEALPELVNALEDGNSLGSIHNLSYKNDGRKIHNSISSQVLNLDDSPFPDFSLIEGWEKSFVIPIETSRGCPFSCEFCCVHKMFKGVRFRNIESVVEEIKKLKPRHIFFPDDNFAINPERTKELLQSIRDNFSKPPLWSAQVRINTAQDKELLELIRETHCWRLFIGLESIDPDTLKEYNKQQTLEEIEEGIYTLHKYGIKIHGMFVVGSDADDLETIPKTVKFAKKTRLESFQLSILTPLPGTSLYQRLIKEGRLLYSRWKDWRKFDGLHSVFKSARFNKTQLENSLFEGMKNFYSKREIIKSLLRREFTNAMVKIYGRRSVIKIERANRM
jgi:radical SAM superfamily enzyme YgiQ (UPF0313 family)